MGFITKKDISRLAEAFVYHTVDNFQVAENLAKHIMQLSYNKNLLKHQYRITQYIGAAIWMLAHKAPVPVADYESASVPVRYRSCIGDLAHLFVLLSYKPKMVLSFMERNERIKNNYGDLFNEDGIEDFLPLAANMNRMIIEENLLHFRTDEFSFRVSRWAMTPIAKPVNYSSYDYHNMSAKSMLIRCNCDLRSYLVEEKSVNDDLSLETLGERFRALRYHLNMTQKQFAEQINIPTLAYQRMEYGRKMSAESLMKILNYYSRLINIDVLFDKRIWQLAQLDQDLLFKKVHIGSVVHRKHQLLKESMGTTLEEVRDQLTNALMDGIREDVRKVVDEKLNLLEFQFETGMNSVLALTEE